jgi:Rho-binding antiterminator
MSNLKNTYLPINCSFYDRLEEAATLKKDVTLEYWDTDKLRQVDAVIKDIMLENKVEWLLLGNDLEIRLDNIHSLDGIVLEKSC